MLLFFTNNLKFFTVRKNYNNVTKQKFMLHFINSFRSNIKFTIEIEKENKIAFLDILLICNKDLVNTTVYRKKTDADIYINWQTFSPNNWK